MNKCRALLPLLLAVAGSQTLQARPPDGGAHVQAQDFADELHPIERLRIQQQLQQSLASAAVRAAIAQQQKAAGDLVLLQWPLRSNRMDRPAYHGVSNFVDHDPAFPSKVRDYVCGARTYDNAGGYNHQGTDYFIWPFPWRKMDDGEVAIVAAAAGVVVERSDGYADRSCAMSGAPWNAVYVRHADGSVAWYGHMKRGSVAALQPGDTIAAGDYLGLVGSSGSSTGPHLHFELQDAAGRVIDPRHGQCNAAPDRWLQFQPYEDPVIVQLSLHSAAPVYVNCGMADGAPVSETTFETGVIAPGSSFHAFAAYRDHRNGDISQFSVLRPDGSVFARWDFDLASAGLQRPFYSATSWHWSQQLPADAPRGYWSLRAEFHGRSYLSEFFVGDATQARNAARWREQTTAVMPRPR